MLRSTDILRWGGHHCFAFPDTPLAPLIGPLFRPDRTQHTHLVGGLVVTVMKLC